LSTESSIIKTKSFCILLSFFFSSLFVFLKKKNNSFNNNNNEIEQNNSNNSLNKLSSNESLNFINYSNLIYFFFINYVISCKCSNFNLVVYFKIKEKYLEKYSNNKKDHDDDDDVDNHYDDDVSEGDNEIEEKNYFHSKLGELKYLKYVLNYNLRIFIQKINFFLNFN
jgi:hypothetical protein